jgi:hypothetical protein
VLADFIVWADGADLLLDVEAAQAEMLMKRLAMYRLRRALAITREEALAVHWSASETPARPMIRALRRWAGAGWPRPMAPAWTKPGWPTAWRWVCPKAPIWPIRCGWNAMRWS